MSNAEREIPTVSPEQTVLFQHEGFAILSMQTISGAVCAATLSNYKLLTEKSTEVLILIAITCFIAGFILAATSAVFRYDYKLYDLKSAGLYNDEGKRRINRRDVSLWIYRKSLYASLGTVSLGLVVIIIGFWIHYLRF